MMAFGSFIFLIIIAVQLSRLRLIQRELLQEMRSCREHLAAMRKYYEREPEPPPLPPELVPDSEYEPQRESLKEVAGTGAAKVDDRARAGREFIMRENDDDPKFFPLKNITLEQAQKIVDGLDAEQPGWDSKFWFPELGMIDP